jgi:cell wall-associated NlpC family hydrolase
MKTQLSEDIEFASRLIGRRWVSGACGPEDFDCWGIVKYIYEKRRGVILPEYPGVTESGRLSMIRNAQHEVDTNWLPLDEPEHFAFVGMSEGSRIHHVGLWLASGAGGVLHSRQGSGVQFQSMLSVRQSGIQNFTFYRLKR